VCKRWRVAHDSVMDKLKPGRWWEGKRHLPLTEGDSAAEEAGAPPSWAAAPPTVMSLLERFHKLTSIDFSSAEVRTQPMLCRVRRGKGVSARSEGSSERGLSGEQSEGDRGSKATTKPNRS
jgi:hypothetical protein